MGADTTRMKSEKVHGRCHGNAYPGRAAEGLRHGGGRVSGGQRQGISLARALLRDPRVLLLLLLLDGATSALDAENEAAVQLALARPRAGRTTIVIAHRLSTVRDADLVVAMADGKAVGTGTHTLLLALEGLYGRLVRSQALGAAG
jgi:subfamily B ATP-binding cassette protein MsbA